MVDPENVECHGSALGCNFGFSVKKRARSSGNPRHRPLHLAIVRPCSRFHISPRAVRSALLALSPALGASAPGPTPSRRGPAGILYRHGRDRACARRNRAWRRSNMRPPPRRRDRPEAAASGRPKSRPTALQPIADRRRGRPLDRAWIRGRWRRIARRPGRRWRSTRSTRRRRNIASCSQTSPRGAEAEFADSK